MLKTHQNTVNATISHSSDSSDSSDSIDNSYSSKSINNSHQPMKLVIATNIAWLIEWSQIS